MCQSRDDDDDDDDDDDGSYNGDNDCRLFAIDDLLLLAVNQQS